MSDVVGLGTCFYVIGFATEVVDSFVVPGTEDSRRLWTTIISSVALACVMVISLIGASFFTKINGLVFLVQFGAIFIGIGGMLFSHAPQVLEGGGVFFGQSVANLRNNTWTDFTVDDKCGGEPCSFSLVFAIIFPAMTGIMEGANLSGDLKDPSGMIGPGTIGAVFCAIVVYLALIFSFAGGT